MSITFLSGTPGSYKSYHAVSKALDWGKYKGNVISNFPIDYSKLKRYKPKGVFEFWTNDKITVDNLIAFAQKYHIKSCDAQTLVIIDEASTMFNSRDFGRSDRLQWINFFANHRHFNFNIILISQNDMMLDKQIRGLIETEIRHRAVANYNFLTFLFSKAVNGLFATIEYWYPCKMRVSGSFHKFDKKKASCYDTMALFIDNPCIESLEEYPKKQDKSKNKKRVRGWSDEQATSNDTQRTQDDNTTVVIDNVNYDVNTGVSTVSIDADS